MMAVAIGLAYFSASWILWTALTIGMLIVFGPRHPPVFDEHVPLDRARVALAFVALLMLVLCFTPAPIRPVDVMRPSRRLRRPGSRNAFALAQPPRAPAALRYSAAPLRAAQHSDYSPAPSCFGTLALPQHLRASRGTFAIRQ